MSESFLCDLKWDSQGIHEGCVKVSERNKLGGVTSSTNGVGVTISYGYNNAAELTGVTSSLSDANHPASLLSSASYNAPGALTSFTLGNNINPSRSYNPRLQMTSLSDGTVYTLGLTYAPNGDGLTANDSVNGNWTYGYDDFNRLKSASATGQAYTFDYDRFGNRWLSPVCADV